jgi:hypothetical protein
MDRTTRAVLVLGPILTILFFFINIYLAGFVFVIFITVLMSLLIMQDSTSLPDITAALSEDAKTLILINRGSAAARRIHVTLVPADREFELPSLGPDGSHTFPLGGMTTELKAVVRFENDQGREFSQSFRLSALGGENDPLKPLIPLFGWK